MQNRIQTGTVYTKPLILLASSVSNVMSHPIILLPFASIAFVQLFFLEILYFSVRDPWVSFFGPIIKHFYGEAYVHYPYNFIVLPELFQYFQVPLYILVSSFFISMAVILITNINNNRNVAWADNIKIVRAQYVQFVVAALIISVVYYIAQSLYVGSLVLILKYVGSASSFWKIILVKGKVVGHILVGVLVTAASAFIFPIIAIEKKSVFAAFISNFKFLSNTWGHIFIVVLIPSLIYVPIMLFRSNVVRVIETGFPEMVFIVLVISCLVIMMIDAIIYTAITTSYLWRKEHP